MTSFFTQLALGAIRGYQRYVSPYKGFSCAYRVHTGCASCSALGFRAIRRYGVARGLAILDSRLVRCGVAHRRYGASASQPPALSKNLPFAAPQAGFCDASCDVPSCDIPNCDGSHCEIFADVLECGTSILDRHTKHRQCKCGPCRDRKPENDDLYHLPPQMKFGKNPKQSDDEDDKADD